VLLRVVLLVPLGRVEGSLVDLRDVFQTLHVLFLATAEVAVEEEEGAVVVVKANYNGSLVACVTAQSCLHSGRFNRIYRMLVRVFHEEQHKLANHCFLGDADVRVGTLVQGF